MSVSIRLRRVGRNNRPFYRVVATDSRCSNTGPFLELLGWYDPKMKGRNFSLSRDRIQYWKDTGAVVSSTVKNLIKKDQDAIAAGAPVSAPIEEPSSIAES